jgi:hypothetical protein
VALKGLPLNQATQCIEGTLAATSELMDGGDLEGAIVDVPDHEVRPIARSSAPYYGGGIVQRDLKPGLGPNVRN